MGYEAANDPYIDKNTGVLRNKLGISLPGDLQAAEAEITYVIIATMKLPKSYKLTDFNYQLYLDMHKNVFGDIYDWAGTIRTIDLSKESSYFAHASYIDNALKYLFNELTGDERLKSDNKKTFVEAITYYHSELNAVHPFREGNGRITRTFLRLLAENRGWNINWSKLNANENIEASKQALVGNLDELFDIIYKRTTRLV